MTVLVSAIAAFVAVFALNGLPQLYHPTLKNERFRRATNDRFFIAVEATDEKFDLKRTKEFLQSLGGTAIEALEE